MNSPSTEDLESLDWGDIFKRLTDFAYRRLGRNKNIEDAQELAQEAMKRFFDPEYADWDPGKEPDIMRHLGSVVNGLVANRMSTKSRSSEILYAPETLPRPSEQGRSAESRYAEVEQAKWIITEVLDKASEDRDGQLVLDLLMIECDAVLAPKEQAARLGISMAKVYEARRKLKKLITNARNHCDGGE